MWPSPPMPMEIGYVGDNGGRPEGNLNGLQLAPVKKGNEGEKSHSVGRE